MAPKPACNCQVLGSTTYSHWGNAGQMRDCIWVRWHFPSHFCMDRLHDNVAAAGAEEMLTTRRHDWEEQGILEELPHLPEVAAPEQLTPWAFKIPLPETDPTIGDEDPSSSCADLLSSLQRFNHKEPAPLGSNSLVYFLHLPRTAGRTLHTCLLKPGTAPHLRCPKAYDHLRIDVAVPNCHLLSSHDDYSVVSILQGGVSVLSHLRDPLDRFLSAYEFAIEIAVRKLTTPRRPARPAAGGGGKAAADKVMTENVWPWSVLVPWFMADMRQRLARLRQADKAKPPSASSPAWARVRHPDGDEFFYSRALGVSKWRLSSQEQQTLLPALDPYNNPLVLPLAEFVEHPLALELLHNGQAMQVLGITNYSHWGDAGSMRTCVWGSAAARASLLEAAVQRLAKFLHVGVTDRLADSVAAAAAAMGFDLEKAAYSTVSAEGGQPKQRHPSEAGVRGAVKRARKTQRKLQVLQRKLDGMGVGGASGGRERHALEEEVREARQQLERTKAAVGAARARAQARGSGVEPALTEGGVEAAEEGEAAEAVTEQAAAEEEDDGESDGLGASQGGSGHSEEGQGDEEGEEDEGAGPGAPSAAPAQGSARAPSVQPLGVEYQLCAQRAQQRSADRRARSLARWTLPDGRGIWFTKEARAGIPGSVLDRIRALNDMDAALYERARDILDRNLAAWQEDGRLQQLPHVPPAKHKAAGSAPEAKFHIPKPLRGDEGEL